MTNYYVKTDGSDSKNGSSVTNAWQHPSHATQIAKAGDTIYLLDGTWQNEECVFANSGTAGSPITITAYSGTPTLDGVDKTGYGISLGFNDHIKVSGLKICRYWQTICDPGSYIHISDCDLSDTGNVVLVISRYDSTHNTIENCTVYDSGWNTIQTSGNREPPKGNGIPATYITIRNCIIYNSKIHNAIDLFGNLQHVLIEGNEFYSNPAGCIFEHDDPDHREHVVIRNNNFHDTDGSCGVKVGCCSFYEIYGNTFKNIDKNYPLQIYVHPHDFNIHDNKFYNCVYGPRVYEGHNIVFDNNYIDADSGVYICSYGAKVVIRNPKGKQSIVTKYLSAEATLEFTDGTVFSAEFGGAPGYTPVRYYPSKSSCMINSGESQHTLTPTTYPITLRPSNAYLTTTNISDVKVMVASSVTNNTVILGNTIPALASKSVDLIVDESVYQTKTANSSGFVSFVYNGTWDKPHTFGWKKGGVTPPPQEHTITVRIQTGSVLKVGGIVR